MSFSANTFLFPLIVLCLMAVPLMNLFLKSLRFSLSSFPAWLSYSLGASAVMISCEPKIAIPVSAGLIVFLFFALPAPLSNSFFRMPFRSESEPMKAWLQILGVCVMSTFAAIIAHLAYLPIRHFFWGEGSGHPSATLQQLLNYLMIGDGVFMKSVYLAGFAFMISFCVPVIEEVTFRGVLETALAPKIKRWQVVGVSATLFALLHQGLELAVPKLVFGILASGLTQHYKSLIPAILIHGMNNMAALFFLLFLILSDQNGVYASMEKERLVQVEKDKSDAEFSRSLNIRSHEQWEREIRVIYEPKLRSQMQAWEIQSPLQDMALDIWEEAAIQDQLLRDQLKLQAPKEVGDRRNSWRVKAWEKKSKDKVQALRTTRNHALKRILGTEERLNVFRNIGVDAISEHRNNK